VLDKLNQRPISKISKLPITGKQSTVSAGMLFPRWDLSQTDFFVLMRSIQLQLLRMNRAEH
jgi:hypothetical protein